MSVSMLLNLSSNFWGISAPRKTTIGLHHEICMPARFIMNLLTESHLLLSWFIQLYVRIVFFNILCVRLNQNLSVKFIFIFGILLFVLGS